MEQDLIEGMTHIRLTKEEEVHISVSGEGKSELLEECSLSLMGRLLTNRKQNKRALKNTLCLVWKVDLDLRIVEVWGLPFDMMSEKTGKDIGNGVNNTSESQQYGEWLRAQGGNKGGSLKNGPTKISAMPNDHQDSEERGQNAVLRMETGRRQEGMGQNQEAGIFPG
nr:hypothetical protein CFP56_50201 [Quercus suber]